jgi:hypothetical protein
MQGCLYEQTVFLYSISAKARFKCGLPQLFADLPPRTSPMPAAFAVTIDAALATAARVTPVSYDFHLEL